MSILKALAVLITSLPEVIRLLKNFNKAIEEDRINRKVKDDLKEINDSFETGNAKQLNDLFANRLRKSHKANKV